MLNGFNGYVKKMCVPKIGVICRQEGGPITKFNPKKQIKLNKTI